MDSKFWGAYHVARAAKVRDGGSLCFISGFRSVRPSANTVLQGAVNAALEALTRGLALEMAPVRVNAVSTGLVATPMWSGMGEADRERMFSDAAERLPFRRIGEASNIANAVLFLACSHSRRARLWWWMVGAPLRRKAPCGSLFGKVWDSRLDRASGAVPGRKRTKTRNERHPPSAGVASKRAP
jgi:NAD(P)-dependent dehydrogenase (short-subunit alcohol dehydrogenase family)